MVAVGSAVVQVPRGGLHGFRGKGSSYDTDQAHINVPDDGVDLHVEGDEEERGDDEQRAHQARCDCAWAHNLRNRRELG